VDLGAGRQPRPPSGDRRGRNRRSSRRSTAELLSTIFELTVAGHDTTTSLPRNSVVALLRNPAQLAQLRSEAAIEEFLRYDAPVPRSIFRYAIEPGQIGDSYRGSSHHLPGRRQPGR
jgi:cytochrome P450